MGTSNESAFTIKPAVREQVPVMVGLMGASGSGKTFSAIRLALKVITAV